MISLFKIVGIIGIILISIGVINKKRKVEDEFYLLGGICLGIYSLHLGDTIFILVQVVFIAAALYDFIGMPNKKRSLKKAEKKWKN